ERDRGGRPRQAAQAAVGRGRHGVRRPPRALRAQLRRRPRGDPLPDAALPPGGRRHPGARGLCRGVHGRVRPRRLDRTGSHQPRRRQRHQPGLRPLGTSTGQRGDAQMHAHTIAQLAHVELLTPKPDETLAFFKDYLGMLETGREGRSVYLRGYQDTYHHSLIVTESEQAGLGHAAYRATSAEALDHVAASIEPTGLGRGWIDAGIGHGLAYRFTTPDGHLQEVIWDVERHECAEGERSAMPNAVQKRPLQGVPVRRIHHGNLMARDVPTTPRFFEEHLSFRTRERIELGDGTELGAWMSVSPL